MRVRLFTWAFVTASIFFAAVANGQNVGIGTPTPVSGKLQINGNRDIRPLLHFLDSSNFGTGSIRFANLSRTTWPITIGGLNVGNSDAQSSLTIFSPTANIAHFTGDGKVGINQITASTTLDVNGNTRSLSMEIAGAGVLSFGYGNTKQADAGTICYGCYSEANRLHIVGAGTSGAGTDRVIKLWSEGGLLVRGTTLPELNNTYSLGRNNLAWRSVWTDSVMSNAYFLRNSTINIKGGPGTMIFSLNTSPLFEVNPIGMVPSADNDIYLGSPSKRFVAVYAATGTIQTSDAKMKTNILSSPYGLESVMQMNPVQFNWKEQPDGNKEIGFLAQEIQKIVPEAVVNSGDNAPLGMKYSELIPVLVKAIQEQQQRILLLEKQLAKLPK